MKTLYFHWQDFEVGGRVLAVGLLARDDAIVGIQLDRSADEARSRFSAEGRDPGASDPGPFREFSDEIARYAAGELVTWRAPYRFETGSPFDLAIWSRIAEIPPGETRSYGELAAAIGSPQGARAAGGSCGRNPLPLRVPCHRVLAARGRLGGFTGVLDTKIALLRHEGIRPIGVEVQRDRSSSSRS